MTGYAVSGEPIVLTTFECPACTYAGAAYARKGYELEDAPKCPHCPERWHGYPAHLGMGAAVDISYSLSAL